MLVITVPLIDHNSYEPGLIRQSLSYWLRWTSPWVIESTLLSSKSIHYFFFLSTYSILCSSTLSYLSTWSWHSILRSSKVGLENVFQHVSKGVSQRHLTLGPKHLGWMVREHQRVRARLPMEVFWSGQWRHLSRPSSPSRTCNGAASIGANTSTRANHTEYTAARRDTWATSQSWIEIQGRHGYVLQAAYYLQRCQKGVGILSRNSD